MITIYIKECEKEEIFLNSILPKWVKTLAWKIMKQLNFIQVKEIEENRKLYLVPNPKKEKVYKKIRKRLEKEKTKTQKIQIVLSKQLKQYESYFQGYKIIDGRTVYISALPNILEYILEEQPLALQDVYLLSNYYGEKSINFIKKIAPKVKTLNIITKEIEKYKILEELLQEQGIMLSVSNNKKKSLKKAKIIINFDFNSEQLTEYSIFRDGIFINVSQEKSIQLKGFHGIIIQNIEVELEEKQLQWIKQNGLDNAFMQIEIYESIQNKKASENSIKIKNVYGNHGIIVQKELQNWQKILTNEKN